MEYKYRCLICGEPYGSHITAMHKLLYFYNFVKKKAKDEYNYGYINEDPLLFEDN